MGTNYYRIPTHEEVENRKAELIESVQNLPIDPASIERGFSEYEEGSWESYSPWTRFTKDLSIHLGKRSSGWRFCWNFHHNEYYSNKEELLQFIRTGRVVDEYGQEIPIEEFIEMALNWCPNGLIGNKEYHLKNPNSYSFVTESTYDREIEGLRVSSTSEFC
jgi:hypothetical protein